jgi:NADH-quinone oxidoreductase subunit K
MNHYLALSAVLFFIGVYGFIARRNMLAVLISVELILNAVELNFSVFNRFLFPERLEGMFFSLFGIAISAAETAVAIAIIINVYRTVQHIDIRRIDQLKG